MFLQDKNIIHWVLWRDYWINLQTYEKSISQLQFLEASFSLCVMR